MILAVDEHDDVGVLLERARLAQVRQLRPVIGARLRRAAQLRQHDDRHAQLLGEPLQRPRDRRQLERAVLEPAAPLHQLDVVDDDQVQAVLGRQAPALGAHLEHADRRRVVDEDLRLAQRADRLRQPAPVALAEEPAAQPVRVDARLAGEHAQEQLLLRHLEAEHADRHVGLRADVLRDVQHEAGLPHRRPGGDDDEVRRLKPGRHLVEIGEAGRHAGDRAPCARAASRSCRGCPAPGRAATRSRRAPCRRRSRRSRARPDRG